MIFIIGDNDTLTFYSKTHSMELISNVQNAKKTVTRKG